MSNTRSTALLRLIVTVIGCVVVAVMVLTVTGCRQSQVLSTLSDTPPQAEVEEGPKYFWPLTNLPADDEQVISARPISMKIDNFPDARPQSGLIDADIVYEVVVEGSMTRFHALFHSVLPSLAGPLRSARSTDAWVVDQWGSYLIFSGATPETIGELSYRGVEMITESSDGRIFERSTDRIAPHNLYVHLDNMAQVAPEFGIDVSSWQIRTLEFAAPESEDAPATDATTGQADAGQSASQAAAMTDTDDPDDVSAALTRAITIPFGGVTARWEWDPTTKTYLRFQDGAEHLDLTSGRQISAKNVVVLWADYYLMEHGLVSMFSGGTRTDGNWTTAGAAPPELRTVDNRPITFQSGNTWFEVVYEGTEVVVE